MKEYNKLTNKQKIDLIDKLILHAENIDKNILVIANPNSKLVLEAKLHSIYFLNIVKKEINKKKI